MRKSHGAMVMILARKTRTRADQARVEERLKLCKCLNVKLDDDGHVCDCQNPANASRGNCVACENAFNDKLKSLSPEEAMEFVSPDRDPQQMRQCIGDDRDQGR